MTTIAISAGITFVFCLAMIIITANAKTSTKTESDKKEEKKPEPPKAEPKKEAKKADKKGNVAIGKFIITLLTIGFAIWIYSDNRELIQNKLSSQNESAWGEIKTLHLSDQPIVVPWPKGALGSMINFKNESEVGKRKCKMVQDGHESILEGRRGVKMKVATGRPYKLSSVDGQPLEITIQWRYR